MCEQENTLLIANNFQLAMGTGYDVLSMLLQFCKANHDFSNLLKAVHKEAFKFICTNAYEPSVIEEFREIT